MKQQSAPNLALTLIQELTRLQVQTLVQAAPITLMSGMQIHALSAGLPMGELPPTNPTELVDRARAVVPRNRPREFADSEVAQRMTAADQLLRRIEARGPAPSTAFRDAWPPRFRTVVEPPPQLDQNEARDLARFIELGERSVACRTLVRIDGDATTQFPNQRDELGELRSADVTRAHSTMALAAMELWPELIRTAGGLIAAVIPRRPGRPRRRRPALSPLELDIGLQPFTWPEFFNVCRRFFAWGRVVFESPGQGPDAFIRSMVHPSGDIETTVGGGTTSPLINTHATMVVTWVSRLQLSLVRLRRWLAAIPLVVAAIGGLLTGTHAFRHDMTSAVWLAASTAVVALTVKSVLRLWLRHRLFALVRVVTERIETLDL